MVKSVLWMICINVIPYHGVNGCTRRVLAEICHYGFITVFLTPQVLGDVIKYQRFFGGGESQPVVMEEKTEFCLFKG